MRLTRSEIVDLILKRDLTVRQVIDAVSGIDEFVLIGLENFDKNIKLMAERRKEYYRVNRELDGR